MPAPSQPGVHEESPGRPGSVLAATLRDIQDCTDRRGKALWRPGPKDSGLPNIKQKDVVATDFSARQLCLSREARRHERLVGGESPPSR